MADDGLVFLPHSLANNKISYVGEMAGVKALCEMLKVNTTLQSIECASKLFPPHLSDHLTAQGHHSNQHFCITRVSHIPSTRTSRQHPLQQ
jgi:hypothetical protein